MLKNRVYTINKYTMSYEECPSTDSYEECTSTESYEECPSTESYDECSICIREIHENVGCKVSGCLHSFHIICISKWLLQGKDSCPYCRKKDIEIVSTTDDGSMHSITMIETEIYQCEETISSSEMFNKQFQDELDTLRKNIKSISDLLVSVNTCIKNHDTNIKVNKDRIDYLSQIKTVIEVSVVTNKT